MTAPRGKGSTPEQQVIALGRLIEDQERQIAGMREEIERRFNAQAGDVAQVKRDVGKTAGTAKKALDLVVDMVQNMGEQGGEEERKLPLNVLMPEDRAKVLQAMRDLRGWLRTVYVRYEGNADQPAPVLSDCWAWHTAAVAELYALHRLWFAAYLGPKASDQLVADWHDRYRPGVVRRVNAALGRCRPDRHVVTAVQYRPPRVHGDELLDELVAWMVDGDHGQQVPPVPTPGMVRDSAARRNVEQP